MCSCMIWFYRVVYKADASQHTDAIAQAIQLNPILPNKGGDESLWGAKVEITGIDWW